MPIPRISDLVSTGQMLGKKLDIKDVIGRDFIARSAEFRTGQNNKLFAVIQGEEVLDEQTGEVGESFWFVCGGESVVTSLKRLDQNFPVVMRIDQIKSDKGRKVYTVV